MRGGLLLVMISFLVAALAFAEDAGKPASPEKVTVETSDAIQIELSHYRRGHAEVVVLAHGFYNSKQAVLFKEMARGLADDYDVIVMDFRGHGKSSGWFSWTVNEHRDLQAVLDYAQKDYDRIGVIGFSLGAAIAINTAARDSRIDSLIAVSAPYDFDRINYRVWKMGVMENVVYNIFQEGRVGKGIRPGWLLRNKPRPIDHVDRIRAPTLFIHGEKDWLIAADHSRKLYQKATCDKDLVILPDGTHAEYIFRADKEGTLALFREWLAKTLPADPGRGLAGSGLHNGQN